MKKVIIAVFLTTLALCHFTAQAKKAEFDGGYVEFDFAGDSQPNPQFQQAILRATCTKDSFTYAHHHESSTPLNTSYGFDIPTKKCRNSNRHISEYELKLVYSGVDGKTKTISCGRKSTFFLFWNNPHGTGEVTQTLYNAAGELKQCKWDYTALIID